MTLAAALTRLHFKIAISVFLVTSLQGEEVRSLFLPPKGWSPNSPSSSRVKVSFFTKGRQEFCPSVNLLEEKTSLSIEQYLKAVKEIYEMDSDNRWRRLGTLRTKAGTAHLTSLDTNTPNGPVRVLQSILVKDSVAYILTGAALKEDFGLYQKDFLETFRSFSLAPTLLDFITDDQQKQIFLEKQRNLLSFQEKNSEFEHKHLEPFKRFIAQECTEQGLYWQCLILEEMYKKLSLDPKLK